MTDRGAWWPEARFGMLIHWGLYAVPAGLWKGQECPCLGEWIMSYFRLTVQEYERRAEQFNPTQLGLPPRVVPVVMLVPGCPRPWGPGSA